MRFLFGPTSSQNLKSCLFTFSESSQCCGFALDPDSGLNLVADFKQSWEAFASGFSEGWQPDLLVLNLENQMIAPWLWEAPIPIVGLATGWRSQWHRYRHILPLCDLVLTDVVGQKVMQQQGWNHVEVAHLFGIGQSFVEACEEAERDIDVLCVCHPHPTLHREELVWLDRIGGLGQRWKVVITRRESEDAYRQLLRRAKIVFMHSPDQELDRRLFEAAASGALIFQNQSNQEARQWMTDKQECIDYDADNLEHLIEQYLTQNDERQRIAEAGRTKAQQYTWASLWEATLTRIPPRLAELQQRASQRATQKVSYSLESICWQMLAGPGTPEHSILETMTQSQRHDLSGVLCGLDEEQQVRNAAGAFQQALKLQPDHLVASLNLTEALLRLGEPGLALEGVMRTLTALELRGRLSEIEVESPHYSESHSEFRIEWEKAAWQHVGDPQAEEQTKRSLLRWRLCSLAGQITDDPLWLHEAVIARPDLPSSRAALGASLAQSGHTVLAQTHLQSAVSVNPLDREAAQIYAVVLRENGQEEACRHFARQQRLIVEAASSILEPEAWLHAIPPTGSELASIIILCCNRVDQTRACLESVLEHTRPPFELILIDNGSTDETLDFLQNLENHPKPARVVVIHNDVNQGYPKGCNQGLNESRGQYLVLLNNDTLVTPKWLDRMVEWSLQEWPRVGLVGPMTNNASAPQQIHPGANYPGPGELESFAQAWRQHFEGQALQVERLTGFCLLLRREVLDAIGPLDERFGIGFFEDDDLCFRAHDAGFVLLNAQDVFIHHEGNQTFKALGIDVQQQLEDCFQLFQQKWGTVRTAGYRLPSKVEPSPQIQRSRPASELWPESEGKSVSLCMIVKDEEANLPACLDSVQGLTGEVVIVDTGSSDRTVEIAKSYGAKVVSFPWVDHFAAARNVSVEHATGDWIFWMDADDRLDEANREKLKELFANLGNENVAYDMKCLCLADPISRTETVVDHIRLFRRHPKIRWEYRVHEQILPSVRRLGGEVRWSDVTIQHTGYQDPALRRKKLERDLRLLEIDRTEHPDEPFILFNLGSIQQELGQHEEALEAIERSLARSNPADSIVRKLYAMKARSLNRLGQEVEALAVCQQGREVVGDDPELLFLGGQIQRSRGNLTGAEALFLRLLNLKPEQIFASIDPAIQGYKARHQLAVVYQLQQRLVEAEAQWRQITTEHPGFLPAWLGLGDLYLMTDERRLEEVIAQLEQIPEGKCDAEVYRVRQLLQRKDYPEARQRAEQAIEHYPDAIEPRVVLSHVLLQEGKDLQAAEVALREILKRDPEHREAHNNLSVLLARQSTPVSSGAVSKTSASLLEQYQLACSHPSDLQMHLPWLSELALGCEHITDLGTGEGLAALAFLTAQPQKLICVDLEAHPRWDLLKSVCGKTDLVLINDSSLTVDLEETDLLLIDTWQVEQQLRAELSRHADKVRKYLIIHGTTTYAEQGESPGHGGLESVLEDLLAQGRFQIDHQRSEGHGFTVLSRISSVVEPGQAPQSVPQP